jgi:hypothetical protein
VFRRVLAVGVLLSVVLATPLAWRAALALWAPHDADVPPSYLPALESRRPRRPFNAGAVDYVRETEPGYVTIGDSMAGRIDPEVLAELASVPVVPLPLNATGPAYWYLVLKNWVAASGARPRLVFIFFRDTLLTDVTFRLDGPYRAPLDEAAHDREPELNEVVAARTSGPWHRVHEAVDALYGVNRAREWIAPHLTAWPARVVVDGAHAQTRLLDRVNAAFTLDKLRPIAQADLEAADAREADFASHVDASVLPLMLEVTHEHGLRLCFVRVLRRPVNGQPPPESPALQRYVADLRAYLAREGADYIDDRDDPELAKLSYGDGDHITRDARLPYTQRFWSKIQRLTP